MSTESPLAGIELSQALNALRDELKKAHDNRSDGFDFEVKEMEVTFEVLASREASAEAEAGGKLRFWVVDADAKAKVAGGATNATTHRVTIKLDVLDERGGRAKVSRR